MDRGAVGARAYKSPVICVGCDIVGCRKRNDAMTKKLKIFDAPADGFAMAPVHPGEVLQEEIAARGLTAHALGLKLRAPANRLTEIINCKRGIDKIIQARLKTITARMVLLPPTYLNPSTTSLNVLRPCLTMVRVAGKKLVSSTATRYSTTMDI